MKAVRETLASEVNLWGFLGDDRQKSHLGKFAFYAFGLLCLLPLVTGLVLPHFGEMTTDPNKDMVMRVPMSLATGGLSFVLAMVFFFMLRRFPVVQGGYVFLLMPVCLVSILMQVIMYKEFGIEINYRVLGLFRENFSTLWSIASKEYHVNWLVALTLLCSLGGTVWVMTERRYAFTLCGKFHIVVAVMLVCSGAMAVGLRQNVEQLAFYHPSKTARVPMFQVAVLGKELLTGFRTSYEGILKREGKVAGTVRQEICFRLGSEPEEYAHRTARRPAWLKRKPSHVFMFLLESIEYRLMTDPTCGALVPHINRYAREGVSVPHFVSAGHCTIEAVHGLCSGCSAIHQYPANEYPPPRTLSMFGMDTLPGVMSRSGYKPLFLSASYRKFRSKGDVCEAYGYDEFIGCPDADTSIRSNDWGVCDGDFFQWARGKVTGLKSPHFITFLNVSNHAPFDAPVEHIRDDRIFTAEMAKHFYGLTESEKLRYAKHIYYADQQVGKMVEALRREYPNALFVFTGDHNGRKLRGEMRGRVPFVLWNDRIVDPGVDTSGWYGTHMDVLATLAELLLPEGESYSTLGNPVWSDDSSRVSIGHGRILCKQGIYKITGDREVAFGTRSEAHDEQLWEQLWHRRKMKASAVEALSWGELHAVPVPSE